MKFPFYILFLVTISLLSSSAFSQGGPPPGPPNDDPCDAIPLTVGTSCSGITGSNHQASNSIIPDETCDGPNSNGDIWYTALIGSNGTLIIQTNPGGLTDMGMAIYTGTSCSTMVVHSCVSGGSPGASAMPYISLSGMTPGTQIWIRLWDVNDDDSGNFQICAYINCSASVSITGATSGCSAAPPQLCATMGFASYSWTGGGASSCINANSTNTYTVTVTDNDGCTATDSHFITVHTSPSFSITGPSTACPEDNAQLCVSGFYTSYAWNTTSTNSCINPSISGTYSVTVSDAFGCTGTGSKAITLHPAASVAITGLTSACAGSSAQLCVPAGFSAYNWSSGETVACITPTSSNNYTVIVTDANGCQATDNEVFTVKPRPSATITGPSSTCNGIAPQLCAPAGDSLYLWSNSNTTSCISPSTSGTYTVTVTDQNGCTSSSSHQLVVNPAFSMTVTGPDSSCGGTSPQLCATNGNYTYQWSNGSSTSCINPTISGTYSVVATNITTGCTKSSSKGLTIFPPLNPAISGPSSACIGSSVQLCATAGGSSYLWSNTQTTQCITILSNGIYNVTITDDHGCTATASQAVVFSTSFTVSISAPPFGCTGSSANLSVPPGYDSYAWSTGDTIEMITVNNPGNYSVTVHDQTGCVANAIKNLQFKSPPNVSITGDTLICQGEIVNWCGTPNFYPVYHWSNGGNASCINVSTDAVYTVEVTDTNGCKAIAAQHLNVVSIHPTIIESNGALICTTTNPSYHYAWLVNGGSTPCSIDTCIPTFNGIYSVIVTDTISNCVEIGTYNFISMGVQYTNEAIGATIYPNPFHGNVLGIYFGNSKCDKANIDVFDSFGKIIYSESVIIDSREYYHTLTIPEISAGIYFVQISNEKGKSIKKIINY